MLKTEYERNLVRYLRKRVKDELGDARKVKWESRRGAPDWLILFESWFCMCEVKKNSDEDLKPHQTRELRRLRLAGIPCFEIKSEADVEFMIRSKKRFKPHAPKKIRR